MNLRVIGHLAAHPQRTTSLSHRLEAMPTEVRGGGSYHQELENNPLHSRSGRRSPAVFGFVLLYALR